MRNKIENTSKPCKIFVFTTFSKIISINNKFNFSISEK